MRQKRLYHIGLAVFISASLLPWFFIQYYQSINVDLAWLTTAAMRFLDGERMSAAYYDPNPPLSVLIYLIPAFLIKVAQAPFAHTLFFYNLTLVALSTWALSRLLKTTGFLSAPACPVFLGAWLLANTVIAGHELGQREHYIILALMPFLLVQAAITLNRPLPKKTAWAVMIAGALVVLIKPHYLLFPAALLLHRLYLLRHLNILWGRDVLTLIFMTAGYGLLLLLLFPDYLTIILPDTLSLYVSLKSPVVTIIALMGVLITLPLLLTAQFALSRDKAFITALCCGALLGLLPFALQGKGFFYHALPFAVFYSTALALIIYNLLQPVIVKCFPEAGRGAGAFLGLGIIVGLSYLSFPPNSLYPTHEDYRRSDMAQVIEECKPGCRFFMFNDMTEITQQLAVYTQTPHGSRFPSYWFLPLLHSQGDPDALKAKYSRMVAEDFRRYKPDILLIGQFKVAGQPFDFYEYFSSASLFAEEWKNYRYDRPLSVDRGAYFGGTLYQDDIVTYNIYRRTDHD